jgi:hypothetical protein
MHAGAPNTPRSATGSRLSAAGHERRSKGCSQRIVSSTSCSGQSELGVIVAGDGRFTIARHSLKLIGIGRADLKPLSVSGEALSPVANSTLNLAIGVDAADPVSGAASHRCYPCQIEKLA